MEKYRASNFELLRTVAMAMVLAVHLDGASVGLPAPDGIASFGAQDWWRAAVESLAIVCVNSFTLISGYFGIRARVGGAIKFLAQCAFYAVGLYTVAAVAGFVTWSWTAWLESWMVLTHTDLWYVPAYMGLYLLSPFLNAAVSSLSRKAFGWWLGAFVVFNLWCGWWWGATFNPTGYTLVQLIMLYLIGRYVRLHTGEISVRSARAGLAVYLGSAAITALMSACLVPAKVYAYNAPWVMAASVGLFLAIGGMRMGSSRFVNWLGAGAFAVYLIHKNPMVWGGVIKPTAMKIWQHGSLLEYTVFTLASIVVIYLFCATADWVRRRVFSLIGKWLGNYM